MNFTKIINIDKYANFKNAVEFDKNLEVCASTFTISASWVRDMQHFYGVFMSCRYGWADMQKIRHHPTIVY